MVGAMPHKVNLFRNFPDRCATLARPQIWTCTTVPMTLLADVDLILASTSIYRRELLARLGAPFRQQSPDVDEAAQPDETPLQLAVRLAGAKAHAVANAHSNALIIGSDQVAHCAGQLLGKPGNLDHARGQLQACSGRSVAFHSAVCLIDTRREPRRALHAVDTTTVLFRTLEANEIERYLIADEPWDCAGSFKAERLGIALFERIESTDPTALIGLPLIALCRLLREAGIEPV